MLKLKMALVSLMFSLFFVGCQGDNSDIIISTVPTVGTTTSSTLPTIILPVSSSVLTTNSQVVSIEVRVFDSANNPYTTGNVNIIYPADVQTGRDVGYFASSSVAVDNAGVATFTYTAPTNLSANTAPLVFGFYHTDNPTQSLTYTFTLNPSVNQVVLTNYTLTSAPSPSITMGLDAIQSLSYYVSDKDGNVLPDSSIISIQVELLNPALGLLVDSNNNQGSVLSFLNQNNVSLNLQTNTISGLLPIKVIAQFNDANGNPQSIEQIFNVTILSGPPTTISLSYAGTSQDAANAKFIESWIVTVSDQYNNRVNTNPAVSMGMMAGYAQSAAATDNPANYLYYNPVTPTNPASATISATGGTTGGASLSTTNTPFAGVDDINDYLVTFGNGYTYDASGKWTFQANSSSLVDLVDDFNGTNVSGLGFAVGHNYRQDRCSFGDEWTGNVYPSNGSNIIDTTGSMKISVSYDYYLTGKDVMLWVNLVGNSNGATVKIGESKKVTLRGQGLDGDTYPYAQGYTGTVRIPIKISNTVEWYKNANFVFQVDVSGDGTVWSVTGTSMDLGITDCNASSGVAFVDVTITNSPTSGGVITVSGVVPTNEF
ncbi:hypothetical protein [Sulfurimonas sp.]